MNSFVHDYVLKGLAGTPDVVEQLLRNLPAGDTRWDARPDPERWTLREIVAHLADWERIFGERTQLMLTENGTTLPEYDIDQLAIDNDYAHSDPTVELANYRARRNALIAVLQELDDTGWVRYAQREWGQLVLEELAVLILGHDAYHTRQIAQWLQQI